VTDQDNLNAVCDQVFMKCQLLSKVQRHHASFDSACIVKYVPCHFSFVQFKITRKVMKKDFHFEKHSPSEV